MIVTEREQKYYSEVYSVLMYLGTEYTKKIPQKLIEVIDKTRDKNANFELDKNKALYEQDVCQETRDFIAALNLLYWEKNKDRKAKLLQVYKKNDIIYKKEQEEKYSYENLFKNNQNKQDEEKEESISENNNVQIIEVKENFIQRVILKIKEWFWRFKK